MPSSPSEERSTLSSYLGGEGKGSQIDSIWLPNNGLEVEKRGDGDKAGKNGIHIKLRCYSPLVH